MIKYFKNITIVIMVLLGIGLSTCYATVVYDKSADVITDSSNDPVSDTNGPPLLPPGITTQPVNVTVAPSAKAIFAVVGIGNPTPTYRWQQEAPGASSFTAIIGATSASYTTPAATTANSGTEYECVVSSVLGHVTSNTATLFVNAAPSIITQPASVLVKASLTATFSVVATGVPAPTYQWQEEASGASSFTAISGATSATYITPPTATANNGTKYECVISNSAGSVTSNAAMLTVLPNPLVAPTITAQPINMTVTAPAPATFTVLATGSPAPTYQWQEEAPGAGSFTAIGGATGNSYKTPATTTANSGTQYECVISNSSGSVTSNAATLTVNPAPVIPTAPVLNTATAGNGQVTLTWAAVTGATKYDVSYFVTSTGVYSPSMSVGNVTSDTVTGLTNGTTYTFVVYAANTSGTSPVSNTLNAKPVYPSGFPTITTQPVSATVVVPAQATFTVAATGSTGLTYQWKQSVNGGALTAISGATSPSYTTPATTLANNGTVYECVVTDTAGSVISATARLTVYSALAVPTILIQPVNELVTAPLGATFTVVASGTPPPTYQWMQSVGGGAFTAISGATSSMYTISATTVANSGTKYECVLTNSVGSITTNVVILTVNPPVIPSITTQPVSLTVMAPASATFKVVATGAPTPTYQWMQEAPGAGTFTVISDATSSSYTIKTTTTAMSGNQYQCVVTNAAGRVTSTAVTMTVNPAGVVPSITDQPANALVVAPATATFTVGATGAGTLTYQWMQRAGGAINYTALSGANGVSYTTPATTMANNGTEYECVVSNAAGSVTSNGATLSVKSSSMYVQSINYNANGQITQIQYGNGTTTAYTYNPLNFRLMRIYTSNAAAQVIQDLNYTYDSVGQVLSIVDNVNTGSTSMNQNFAYDALNRLTSANGSYGSKTYAYDSIGNITQKDGLTYNYAEANSRTNGTAAGPHAVTSLSDGSTFKYDANGNMVSLQKVSNLTQYVYDSQNRLQNVTVGGLTAATYTYDGDGGRTQKTVYRRDLALYNDNTNALLFGSADNPLPATAQNPTVDTTTYVGNVYETESGVSRSTRFIYLGDTKVASVDSSGNVYYYHADHLGGTNVLTDNTGEVRELTEYDPFGQVFVHEKYGSDFATAWYYFTGKPLDDETGLIFLGARYYNPSLGRFITPDTVVQAPGNPQTLNRYTYCNNNPVNLVDPTGHSWWKKFWHSVAKVFEDIALIAVAIVAVALLPETAPGLLGFVSSVAAGAAVGAAIGGVSTSILGGDMGQGILTGAISGAIFGGIGSFGLSGPAQIAAHAAGGAASGAIDATIQGGNAGVMALVNGLSAGASEWAGESQSLFKFTGSYMTDVLKQAAIGGVVGGAASSAMGGNFGKGFESGAVTSAIAYTANSWIHDFSQSVKTASGTTSVLSFALGVAAFATGYGEIAATAFAAGRFFGYVSLGSAVGQAGMDLSLREFEVAGLSYAVSTATEGAIGSSSIYGQSQYLHESFTSVSGAGAGQATECFANGKC